MTQSVTGARHHAVVTGIGFTVAAVACFAVSDTLAKYVTSLVPLMVALWFRYVIQALVTTVIILPKRGVVALRTAHPKFQILRGVLLATTSLLAFLSLRYMPVGEFTAIVMISPLVITLLAGTLLGEKVSKLRWVLMTGGFVGALVIIRPGHEAFQWTALLPLCLVATNSWFQVLTSRLAKTEDPMTMQFYTGWVGAAMASVALPFVWTSMPSTALMLWMAMMACLVTAGHFMLTVAYQRAPAVTLTPYFYLQICFAMLCGWVAFSHIPDGWAIFGMAMIAVCGAAGGWLTVHEGRKTHVLIQPPES